MRAAVFQGPGFGHKIERVPEPVATGRDVLIKVQRSGVCATDLTITERRDYESPLDAMLVPMSRPGIILGHEFAGEIVALGPDVTQFKLGDRVTPGGMTGCGKCLTCLSGKPDWCASASAKMGGYAEYALANENSCALVPATLSLDDSALIEPLATCLHAVRLANLEPGARVAVFGAGPMGLGIALLARKLGAGKVAVLARTERQKDFAYAMGADAFLTQGQDAPQRLVAALGGPPDVVFESSGAFGVLDQAIAAVRLKGLIVSLAMSAKPDSVFHALAMMKEIRIQYALSYVLEDFYVVAEMLDKGGLPFHKIITKRVTFDEFPAAFEALRSQTSDCKVHLVP